MRRTFLKISIFTAILSLFAYVLIPDIQILADESAEDSAAYYSEAPLSELEKAALFTSGYTTIIEGVSDPSSLRGTYTETTCISMKKRGYDWVGYSSQCFQETYTAVYMGSSNISMSISLLGITIPVTPSVFTGSSNGTGAYALSSSDLEKVTAGTHYSCMRMRAYSTYAVYRSKVYDNGTLVNDFTYSHTYNYKSNHNPGFDYYLVARTSSQCSQILNNGRAGTNAEVTSMGYTSWVTVSNPATASIYPWQ